MEKIDEGRGRQFKLPFLVRKLRMSGEQGFGLFYRRKSSEEIKGIVR